MIVSNLNRVHGRPKWPPGNWLPPDSHSMVKCHTLNSECYLFNDTRMSLSQTRSETGGSL